MSADRTEIPGSITILSHADTDRLVITRALENLPLGFPKVECFNLQQVQTDDVLHDRLLQTLGETRIIIARLLGKTSSVRSFGELLKEGQKSGKHLIVLSGTSELNPEFSAISTVPANVIQEIAEYFHAGGFGNMTQVLRYLSDELLGTDFGYAPPEVLPEHGVYNPASPESASSVIELSGWLKNKPVAGICFYRAHWLSGNTKFVDALIDALQERGINSLAVFTASPKMCREGEILPEAYKFYHDGDRTKIDLLINTTSFASSELGTNEKHAESISANALLKLDVPVVQAICSGMLEEQWLGSNRGLTPLDTAMNVVLPEFDGRIISVPISFKGKSKDNELPAGYEPIFERVERVAGLAEKLIRLRRLPNKDKRIAFILTNSNAKASQIGNAVGLDAPESLVRIMEAMRDAGYSFHSFPGTGTALIHDLISRSSYDETILTEEQMQSALANVPASQYRSWFMELPGTLRATMEKQWGAAPGEAYVYDGKLMLSGCQFGNAVVILQPPRGYGMDPNAIYHMPDLPPTHHYYDYING